MPEKFLRSALVNGPLPPAMLAATDEAARLSWSARKKQSRGRPFVSLQTASAEETAFWWTSSVSKAKGMGFVPSRHDSSTARE
jgi:hypothetical protein